ncbi:MAG: AAA family ATPase, partial [Gammaproteobacteria bacterium]
IGCGKTTLVHHLINNYHDDVIVGYLYNTPQNMAELMQWIMLTFDLPFEGLSEVAMHQQLQKYLVKNYTENIKTVLIVDEAQNLSIEALESLRMLSNINHDKHQLLQMILVGQPQLKKMLLRPELQQFNQRVSVEFFLTPLEIVDVKNYIQHRLKKAGRTKEIFTEGAYQRIAEASKGIPRVINVLCDLVLVYGYSSGQEIIDEKVVDEVIQDKERYGVFSVANDNI